MQTFFKKVREELKLLPPEKRKSFLDNVAKLIAVRPYRFSEDEHAQREEEEGSGQ